jgi:hypothetical protein
MARIERICADSLWEKIQREDAKEQRDHPLILRMTLIEKSEKKPAPKTLE